MIEYVRDPAEIYRRSLAAVRDATSLEGVDPELAGVALRIVHATGEPALATALRATRGAASRGRAALRAGVPILCDARMVADGIQRARLPRPDAVDCMIDAPDVAERARREGTTRAAAAIASWRPRLAGCVVAIGNAPTALFRLLEELDAGAARPALIVAMPVGFVGAAESKEELLRDSRGVDYIALVGRRGGSACAAATVNALLGADGEWP